MITVYPLPADLPTNPIFDRLYTPLAEQASDLSIRRLRPRYALPALFFGRGKRILHLHFFDELTQRPKRSATIFRTIALLLLILLLKLRGVRLVWTAHNLEPHELFHPFWGFVAYRCVARWSDAIIAHSESARHALEARYGPLPHCRVIPLGNYVGQYGPIRNQKESRTLLGLEAQQPILLCAGTLRPYKNVEGLIAAFKQLPQHQRGLLLIAGSAKSKEYLASLQAETEGVADIRFDARYLSDQELPTYLAAADLVLLPYHSILTSAMLLCALSYARPVLAPNFGPVGEIVHEGVEGFLFDPKQADGLEEALKRALQYPDLTALQAAALSAAQPFDWRIIAAKTADLYREVAQL
jgi:beta-1,4-mannosyltransferase